MFFPPEVAFALAKSLICLKISPLLVYQLLRVVNSTVLPAHKCPAYVWPINLTRIPARIPAPLANQIMAVLSRLIGS